MAHQIEYEDYSFQKKENIVEVSYLSFFMFTIPASDFHFLGNASFKGNTIHFDKLTIERAQKKLYLLFSKYKKRLVYKLNKNPVFLVDESTQIPLVGLQFLGIVDKGSEMIEIKPITNCNMNCTFCSVDEGPDSRKQMDFLIEPDYLLEKFDEFMNQKSEGGYAGKYNVWINPHGEPLLYGPIVKLVKGLREHKQVGDIIIITNGMLLTPSLIDKLAEAGLSRFSVSLHAIDEEKSKQLFGTKAYSIAKVKEMLSYAASKVSVAITPVYLKGMNETEMVNIIDFANKIGATVEIQKFCVNKRGRNPLKEQSWDSFFEELKQIEVQSKTQLIKSLGKLQEPGELPKPFKKGDIIEVEIVCSGRMKRDKIGFAQDRAVLVLNCPKEKGRVKVKLIQSKHNVFIGIMK